jgi:replication factor C small subunit
MSKQEMANILWVEKFRPKSIKDLVLPATLKTFFTKQVNKKDIPNMLFYSTSPGTGKTSTAKALCTEIGAQHLYINASKSGSIDTLRNEIERFVMSVGIGSKTKMKVVILDECDRASDTFQDALKAFIEEYHKYCRFILTSNNIHKIIKPLRESRCQNIPFAFDLKEVVEELKPKILKRLKGILDFEKVIYDEDVLVKVVEKFYPDIRRMINTLSLYSEMYGKIDSNIFTTINLQEQFFKFIMDRDLTNARKYIIENNVNIDDLYRELFDNLIPMLPKENQGKAILIIADYMKWHSFANDKEIHIAACILELIGCV